MLRDLKISNLALIDNLHISFGPGLTVLTGETGAGKSIILQAIHLLGGGKGVADWLRAGADHASVEAFFEIGDERPPLVNFIREQGFECDGELVVKRVFSGQGRSRYFINGSMATARSSAAIVGSLLNVASQHDQQQLLSPGFPLEFIDMVGGLAEERSSFAVLFEKWSALKKELAALEEREQDKERRREFLQYQFREIKKANIQSADEDEQLLQERERLKAADGLMSLGRSSCHMLTTALESLHAARKNLEQIAALDSAMQILHEQVAGISYQLDDHTADLCRYANSVHNDPARLESLSARLSQLQELKRKFGGSLGQVQQRFEVLGREIEELDLLEDRLRSIRKELADCGKVLVSAAERLSRKRQSASVAIAETVSTSLKGLCLEHASFEIAFPGAEEKKLEDVSKSGWDRPEFMFSANPGEPLKPVVRIASGGELSRLMLSLKCLLAQNDLVETVIFDEVDSGIGGKTAESVARKIRELSTHHQVLCITHLAQIASFADDHFFVEKKVSGQCTQTIITELGDQERICELARMLDGDSATDQTIKYVQELWTRNRHRSVVQQ